MSAGLRPGIGIAPGRPAAAAGAHALGVPATRARPMAVPVRLQLHTPERACHCAPAALTEQRSR